jgi:hypothetical protein
VPSSRSKRQGIINGEERMKNFHLPLPEETYARLRTESERAKIPATALAREAIDAWLRLQARAARHEAIASFARRMGGTGLDLDPYLEAAGIEHVLETTKAER